MKRKKGVSIFSLFSLVLALFLLSPNNLFSSSKIPSFLKSLAQPDDIYLEGTNSFVLFASSQRFPFSYTNYPTSNAQGSIIAIGFLDLADPGQVNIGSPFLRLKGKNLHWAYQSITTSASPIAQVISRLQFNQPTGEKGQIETKYRILLDQNQIDIISTITNTGSSPWTEAFYSLYFNPLTRYRFSPYSPQDNPDLNFTVLPRKDYYLAWVAKSIPAPQTLSPGGQIKIEYSLLIDKDPASLLKKIYGILRKKTKSVTFLIDTDQNHPFELIIYQAANKRIFFRSFLKPNSKRLTIPLPFGVYLAEIHWFPATSQQSFQVSKTEVKPVKFRRPRHGKITVFLRDSQGKPIWGKVTIHGIYPTPTPYFQPVNPRLTGRNWETFKNSCFPPPEGLTIELPPGGYLITASRGPEYSLVSEIIEVVEETSTNLSFTLKKVVDSSGWISLDSHLHTLNSDGQVTIEERIKSVIAEGIQVAIATDHNYITDYRPALNKLGLTNQLMVISGNEITHSGLIHYNSYPLNPQPNLPLMGAIDATKNRVLELFAASRRQAPQGIIQVNHPRSGSIGYFNTHHLDPKNGEAVSEDFDFSFDVMEGMNGPFPRPNNAQAIKDWLNFLNKGYYYPLVGSSDAHTIDRGEPGYSRTYVAYKGQPFPQLDLQKLLLNLKKGHSFITNGPFLHFRVNEKAIPGDLITDKDGQVKIEVKIQRAPWVEVNKIVVIANGQKIRQSSLNFTRDQLSTTFATNLTITKDTYLVVEVSGERSLFPVVQRLSRSGQAEKAALPYAITNPVFIDFDGNGRFDPPYPGSLKKIPRLKSISNKKTKNKAKY